MTAPLCGMDTDARALQGSFRGLFASHRPTITQAKM